MNKLKRTITFKYFMIHKISKANCCRVCYYNDMDPVPVPLETEVILQDNKRKNSFVHSEDLVLKSAAAYFGDELIHWLGIKEKALRPAPTELVEIEAILYVLASKFLDNEELELIKEAITMTKLGQMIWDDAIEVGEKRASERYSRLILILSQENKDDLIVKIASDPEYRETLYKKYGI